jgi:hypothetical protein
VQFWEIAELVQVRSGLGCCSLSITGNLKPASKAQITLQGRGILRIENEATTVRS